MSDPRAPRPSAWPGLEPSAPRFEPAPAELARAIEGALGVRGRVERIANAGEADSYLRLTAGDGTRWFVKAVPAERAREMEQAEAIARWLAQRGAPVVAAAREPRALGARVLLTYPYVEARAPAPTIADARALGAALAKLHAALAAHPDVAAWRADTARRLEDLERVRAELARGELRAGPDPERLALWARDAAIDFGARAFAALGTAVPSHGDLNLFNVLVTAGGPLFLDLEEVHHSVLPAAFDVATVCERAILVRQADDAAAHAAMAALAAAYAEASGSPPLPLAGMPGVLRALALRALCVRARIDPRGDDAREWAKFFALMDGAGARAAAFGARGVSA